MALGREEINRKLLHVLSGSMIPAGIFYLPKLPGVSVWFPAILLCAATVALLGIEMLRFRVPAVQRLFYSVAGKALRQHEQTRLTGATYIFAAGAICAIVFINQPHVAFVVLCLFILGDAAAALVGQAIGRIRINGKTIEGTLGCLVMCLVLSLAVFPFVPGLLDSWGGRMPLGMAVMLSVATAVQELFPIRLSRTFVINDNLSVPLVTGLLAVWIGPYLV
jgi:dolichol kinase